MLLDMTYQNFVTNQRLSHAIKSSHFKIWLQKRELELQYSYSREKQKWKLYQKRNGDEFKLFVFQRV